MARGVSRSHHAVTRGSVASSGGHRAGRWEEARALYRWYTPLLHLDTKVKLVQYIKLAMAETGMGSETVRAPRLPLVGAEREEILAIVRHAIATRPALPRPLGARAAL